MDVVEFMLLGARHAVPELEVEDIVPLTPYRPIPNVEPIVAGVARQEDRLLPVIDLATVFSRKSIVSPTWKMMLVRNGDFQALVLTEHVFGKRRIGIEMQRAVPIVLPHSVVYGCYPDASAVRLILNVLSLAVHFDRSLVKDFLGTISREMEEAHAELLPALLPEEYAQAEKKEAELPPAAAAMMDAPMAASVSSAFGEPEHIDHNEVVSREVRVMEEAGHPAYEEARESIEQDAHGKAEGEESIRPDVEAESERQEAEERERLLSEEALRQAAEEQTRVEEEKRHLDEEVRARQEDAIRIEQEACARAEEERIHLETEARAREEAERARIETDAHEEAERPRAEPEEMEQIQSEGQGSPEEEGRLTLEAEEAAKTEAAAQRDAEGQAVQGSEPDNLEQANEPPLWEIKKEEASDFIGGAEEAVRKPREETAAAPAASFGPVFIQAAPGPEARESQPPSGRKYFVLAGVGIILAGLLLYFMLKPPFVTMKGTDTPEKAIQTKESPERPGPGEPLILTVPENSPIEEVVYIVKEGDTLWEISKRFTGSPFNYPKVARDNRIVNPDLIFPNQKVRIVKEKR